MKKESVPPAGKKEIFSWCCYDFANSSFTTVIVTVVFSAYFMGVICGKDSGYSDYSKTLWGAALAVSQLLVVFLGPWLGAIADRRACKKQFLTWLAILCPVLTALLYFTGPGTVALAFCLFVAGNFAFSLGENICASFLPELSTPETSGKISGYGWSFGYLGGLVSLALALVVIKNDLGVRLTFPITGLFFLVAALPTIFFLKERATPKPRETQGPGALTHLMGTLRALPANRNLMRFLISFFLYMCGLCSIVGFAGVYAKEEPFHFTDEGVLMLFITLQISSALGAFGFGFLQDRLGARFALAVSLVLWIVVCVWGAVASSQTSFFIMGNIAGIVIGSTQSASRAVISMLTPPGQEGEYFGLWGFFGKLAAVVGPLAFGVAADSMNSHWAIAMLALFFIAGLIMLRGLNLTASARADLTKTA